MGGPETLLGFLDLLLIVWFSGTPGGEFRNEPVGGAGKLGERGFAKLLAGLRRRPLLFSLPWVLYSSVAPPGYLPALQARTGVPW